MEERSDHRIPLRNYIQKKKNPQSSTLSKHPEKEQGFILVNQEERSSVV